MAAGCFHQKILCLATCLVAINLRNVYSDRSVEKSKATEHGKLLHVIQSARFPTGDPTKRGKLRTFLKNNKSDKTHGEDSGVIDHKQLLDAIWRRVPDMTFRTRKLEKEWRRQVNYTCEVAMVLLLLVMILFSPQRGRFRLGLIFY